MGNEVMFESAPILALLRFRRRQLHRDSRKDWLLIRERNEVICSACSSIVLFDYLDVELDGPMHPPPVVPSHSIESLLASFRARPSCRLRRRPSSLTS